MPPPPPPAYKTCHQTSPLPERKSYSKEKEELRIESRIKVTPPQAFKFYMEQHVENIMKTSEDRRRRRQQLEKEMMRIGLDDATKEQMRKILSQKESNYLRSKRAKMDKSQFKTIKTIGLGAFGEVTLVRKHDPQQQQLYAMKTLKKVEVLKRNQVAHVKAERDILAEADNEWVVKLYYSFQDRDNLYFVMDYIPGGDLMSLLIKFGIFQGTCTVLHLRAGLRCGQRAQDGLHPQGHQARQHSDRRQRPHQADRLWAVHWVPVDSQQQILPEQRKDTQRPQPPGLDGPWQPGPRLWTMFLPLIVDSRDEAA